MLELFYFFRSLIFYLGYASIIGLLGLVSLAVFPLLSGSRQIRLLAWVDWLILGWARVACGIRFEIIGRENIPSEPCVVISNHESAWETYCLGGLFQPQSTVLKKELLKIPVFGWILHYLKPIAIDRSKPAAALRQLLSQGRQRLAEGCWVVIFPEGTRVRPGKTSKFNKGGVALACLSQSKVLPVAHNAGLCWPAGTVIKRPGVVLVVIGPAMDTLGRNRDELHEEVEAWIRAKSHALRGGSDVVSRDVVMAE